MEPPWPPCAPPTISTATRSSELGKSWCSPTRTRAPSDRLPLAYRSAPPLPPRPPPAPRSGTQSPSGANPRPPGLRRNEPALYHPRESTELGALLEAASPSRLPRPREHGGALERASGDRSLGGSRSGALGHQLGVCLDTPSLSHSTSAGHDASTSTPLAPDSTNPETEPADTPEAVQSVSSRSPERNAVTNEPTDAGG